MQYQAAGVWLRQIWPRGHCELELQVQRPLTFDGCELHEVVTESDLQVSPPAQELPQPPQLASLESMFTALPLQHTSEASPHW